MLMKRKERLGKRTFDQCSGIIWMGEEARVDERPVARIAAPQTDGS